MSEWKPESMFVGSYTIGGTTAVSAVQVTPEWRRWIAENVLRQSTPESIVQAMVKAGVDPQNAAEEVRAAINHPYITAARQLGTSGVKAENLENKLNKRDWVLQVYRRSAQQATTFGQVPRVPKLSRQEFLDGYYSTNRPVVMTGAMDDWPAMTQWTDVELKRRFGDRVIEVQANRNTDAHYELNQVKLKKEMTFGEYIDLIQTVGETNDYYITANNSGKNKEALGELWDDIVVFPEYLRDDDPANRGFFWFGPKGTVTPLHHDLTNNFMAQVRGRKLVRLIAPYELPNLYNNRHCYSAVDLGTIDFEKFPLFKNVTVIDVVIDAGDLLFLPIGWWHYVRGLDVSITMTFTNFLFNNDFHSFYTTYHDI